MSIIEVYRPPYRLSILKGAAILLPGAASIQARLILPGMAVRMLLKSRLTYFKVTRIMHV